MRSLRESSYPCSLLRGGKKVTGRRPPSSPAILLPAGEWPHEDLTSEDLVDLDDSGMRARTEPPPVVRASMEASVSPHWSPHNVDVAGSPLCPSASFTLRQEETGSPRALSRMRAMLGASGTLTQALQDALGEVRRSADAGAEVGVSPSPLVAPEP